MQPTTFPWISLIVRNQKELKSAFVSIVGKKDPKVDVYDMSVSVCYCMYLV